MFFIAKRYLFSKKSHSVVNIICWVSLVALLLPVAAVVVLLSIFNGFGGMVADLDAASQGDLTIRAREGRLFDIEQLDSSAIEDVDGVEALSFVTEQMMLIQERERERGERGEGRGKIVTVRGVDYRCTSVVPIAEHVSIGEWGLTLGDLESVVIGRSVAGELGIRSINIAEVELVALRTGALQSYLPAGSHTTLSADVSGFLELDEETEATYVYASQRAVNKLLNRDNVASSLVVKVTQGLRSSQINKVKERVQAVAGDGFEVLTRAELNPMIYHIIRYEKYGIVLICSLVMIIAAFSLLGAITMLILEKRGDIYSLRAIGATLAMVRRIFLFEGWIIGFSAILFGIALGVGLTLAQQFFGIIELPTSSTLMSTYPVELMAGDVLAVAAIAAAITLVLSYATVSRVFATLSREV